MWPPVPTVQVVVRVPVATLDPRRKPSRAARRRNTHGRQHLYDRLAGKLSPKKAREAGL